MKIYTHSNCALFGKCPSVTAGRGGFFGVVIRCRRALIALCVALSAASAASGQQAPIDTWPPGDPVSATFDPNGPYDNAGLQKDPGSPTGSTLNPDGPEHGAPVSGDDPAPHGGPVPPNNACSSATVIPANVVVYNPALLDITGATTSGCEPNESCEVGGVGTSNSVWYSYTPAMSGLVEINTLGSNFDTVLSVWDGCSLPIIPCSYPDELACQDNDFGPQSVVTLNVIAGRTYKIKVADYNTTDGGGSLNFNLTWFPPNDQCANATVIPSVIYGPPTFSTTSAGTDTCESAESCELNNVGVSNTVWYSYTAPCDGTISINTNGSSYDTVLSVWDRCGYWPGVDYPCNYGQPAPVQLACDDDSGTGTASQIMNVPVESGNEYLIKVADYNTTNGGGTLDFNFVFTGANPPTAIISSPSPLACVCGSVNVTGTAAAGFDPVSWTLDYQQVGASGWTQISTGNVLVLGLSLGTWNTAGLPQGYYFLRLTVQNACGLVSTAVGGAFVDQTFDSLDVRAPLDGNIVAGTACVDGTAWDQCFSNYTVMYRPQGGGAFTPVDAGMPVYNTGVSNDPLAGSGWNTTSLADGNYELRVQGTDVCGHSASVLRTVSIDNTLPIALISSPTSCGTMFGGVAVMGTANDAHLAGWSLQYTGGSSNSWVTIASGNSPVINGLLGNWNTAGLPPCAYTLRLIVTDASSLNCGHHAQAEYTVSVNVGSPMSCCDVNHDGLSNGLDVVPFVTCLLNGICP